MRPRTIPTRALPISEDAEEDNLLEHNQYRSWCPHCVDGHRVGQRRWSLERCQLPFWIDGHMNSAGFGAESEANQATRRVPAQSGDEGQAAEDVCGRICVAQEGAGASCPGGGSSWRKLVGENRCSGEIECAVKQVKCLVKSALNALEHKLKSRSTGGLRHWLGCGRMWWTSSTGTMWALMVGSLACTCRCRKWNESGVRRRPEEVAVAGEADEC